MGEAEVFRGRGPIEHEFVTSVLSNSGIQFVARTPAGIAGHEPIGPTTPFAVLVADDVASAAEAALAEAAPDGHELVGENVEETEVPDEHETGLEATRREEIQGADRFPPSPWNGRDVARGVVCAVLLMTAFLFLVWRESLAGDLSFAILDLLWTAAMLVTVLAPIWFFTVQRKGSAREAFIRPVPSGVVLFTVLGAFLFTVLDRFVWSLVDAIVEVPSSNAYWWDTEAVPSGIELASLALMAVVVAPVIEEVLFRGILLRYLGSVLRPTLAVTITALLFAVLHFQPIAIPSRFLFGVVAAILVYATRSLYPALAFHMTLNGMSLLAFTGARS